MDIETHILNRDGSIVLVDTMSLEGLQAIVDRQKFMAEPFANEFIAGPMPLSEVWDSLRSPCNCGHPDPWDGIHTGECPITIMKDEAEDDD